MDLSWNSIGDSGAASLSQALAVNSSLTSLDLSVNIFGDSGAAALSHVRRVYRTVHVDGLVLFYDLEERKRKRKTRTRKGI